MYADALGENGNTWYILPGKQSTIFESNKERETLFICKNYLRKILRIGRKIWEEAIHYDTDKHFFTFNCIML